MTKRRILIYALAVLAITSCRKNDDEVTEEPTKGTLTLTTDWTDRSQGINIPVEYTVVLGETSAILSGTENPYPEPLEPGTYQLTIYHTADKITIDGTSATVETTDKIVDPLPGWLFTYAGEVVIEGAHDHRHTAMMSQQVRQLSIELTVNEGNSDRITTIDASLSGIANTVDFKTREHTGTGLRVIPVFERNDDKLTSRIRLLGLSEQSQLLTLILTFTDGSTQTIETDITDKLATFNTGKHIPLALTAELNLPVEAGFGASVTNWTVNEENILVN